MTFVILQHQVLLCLRSILATIQRMWAKWAVGSAWALSTFLAVAVGTGLCAEHPSETTVATPKVTSVTQLTHDGVSKTNLLSDDSNLYVTELPSTERVLARFSLPSASRSFISSGFTNIQALDVSPDRASLLVAPMQVVSWKFVPRDRTI